MERDPSNLSKHVGKRLTVLTGKSKFNSTNGVPFNALFWCEIVEWTEQDLVVRILSPGSFEGQLWKQSEAQFGIDELVISDAWENMMRQIVANTRTRYRRGVDYPTT